MPTDMSQGKGPGREAIVEIPQVSAPEPAVATAVQEVPVDSEPQAAVRTDRQSPQPTMEAAAAKAAGLRLVEPAGAVLIYRLAMSFN